MKIYRDSNNKLLVITDYDYIIPDNNGWEFIFTPLTNSNPATILYSQTPDLEITLNEPGVYDVLVRVKEAEPSLGNDEPVEYWETSYLVVFPGDMSITHRNEHLLYSLSSFLTEQPISAEAAIDAYNLLQRG